MIGTRIHITGIVQGVGFRPFVYNQAIGQALTGWVCNTSAGVDIEVYGDSDAIFQFVNKLKIDAPPLSRIDTFEHHEIPFIRNESFIIIESKPISDAFQPISPDISICIDCLNELFDPNNRRYRYPFINCTNCGPRLTIIEDIPYDRPKTTMKEFQMCPNCMSEYKDPTDRRFHAQPIACPECGPQIWLEIPDKNKQKYQTAAQGDEAIKAFQDRLLKGQIIAIKGLGGFHLACDATNLHAVSELRRRKLRVDKPFAVMMADMEAVLTHCILTDKERELIQSKERPIIILPRHRNSSITNEVSPRQDTIGVMLPYTPLHYLLFSRVDHLRANKKSRTIYMPPMVMTSGNLSEEPIAIDNDEARSRLIGLADAFLMHNRKIDTRCDDSVIRIFRGASYPLRRSRGYTPYPVYLPISSPPLLAVGGELKNSFCIARDRYAFMSQHIGDMENVETFESFKKSISRYESLFRVKPQAIAYDLHPNYLATRYAIDRTEREEIRAIGIQHHHAHIVACMAENSLDVNQPVIGVAFDGTGYGEDGAIWGGEFLLSDYGGYKRVGHLKYIPLPGGDRAIKKPARAALALLWACGIDWEQADYPNSALCAEERSVLRIQLEKKINSPLTSSMGRLFDAAAAIAGIRQIVNYEAQAAIEFEAIVDLQEKNQYELAIEKDLLGTDPAYQIDPTPMINGILSDLHKNTSLPIISARFHNSLASIVVQLCSKLRQEYDVNHVVLSGGVWQNLALLNRAMDGLREAKFDVFIHKLVPTNDGGIALGQAAIAAHWINIGK